MTDIDQAMFGGSFALQEVVFFHRASRTAIFGDLVQRFPEGAAGGLKGIMMRGPELDLTQALKLTLTGAPREDHSRKDDVTREILRHTVS